MQKVSFRRMDEGTSADFALLNRLENEFVAALPERILFALQELEQSLAGFQISRLEYSLQSATRAQRDVADKNTREIYRGYKWFDSCEKFCERWDQMSFDPEYDNYSLLHFEPMVREIFSRPPFDPCISGDGP